jgi:hypothetical protein
MFGNFTMNPFVQLIYTSKKERNGKYEHASWSNDGVFPYLLIDFNKCFIFNNFILMGNLKKEYRGFLYTSHPVSPKAAF